MKKQLWRTLGRGKVSIFLPNYQRRLFGDCCRAFMGLLVAYTPGKEKYSGLEERDRHTGYGILRIYRGS